MKDVSPPVFEEYARLRRVEAYVRSRYAEPIDLQTVAEIALMERSAFSRFFSQKVGFPFSRWLSHVRLHKACELLTSSGDRNITDIAFDVGFSNLRSFQRSFKRHFGMTPVEYRRGHRPRGPLCSAMHPVLQEKRY